MGTEESGEFEPQAAYNETEMHVWEDAAPEDSFEYFSTVERVRSYLLRKPSQPGTRLFLPPGNEVCEGYVFTRVCHSVHSGGCLDLHPRGRLWGLVGGCPGPHLGGLGPHRWLLLWTVCILLECILVVLLWIRTPYGTALWLPGTLSPSKKSHIHHTHQQYDIKRLNLN